MFETHWHDKVLQPTQNTPQPPETPPLPPMRLFVVRRHTTPYQTNDGQPLSLSDPLADVMLHAHNFESASGIVRFYDLSYVDYQGQLVLISTFHRVFIHPSIEVEEIRATAANGTH